MPRLALVIEGKRHGASHDVADLPHDQQDLNPYQDEILLNFFRN